MNRRAFIASALGAVAFPLSEAYAQYPVEVQVPLTEVIRNYNYQECIAWCWAASAAMLFAFYDHPVDQKVIVQRLFGGLVCTTVPPNSIYKLLNSDWQDRNGEKFHSRTHTFYNYFAGVSDGQANVDIVETLRDEHPMLLCTTHHAMVLTEAKYLPTTLGPRIVELGVADPFPPEGALRSLSPAEGTIVSAGGALTILAKIEVSDVDE